MMSKYRSLFVLLLLAILLGGCSTENPDAVFGGHSEDYVCTHSADALQDPTQCTSCHGADYNGSGSVPGCFDCHLGSAPTFSVHPDSWAATITDHQPFAFDNSWTTCSVADCHGADLRGGSNTFCATGPSCFTAVGCHTTPDNSPPPPQSHIASPSYVDARDHGPDAKNAFNDGGQFYCRNCHGLPLNNFDGGYVTTAILGHPVANGACSACHPSAKAHYTNWQGTNDGGIGDLDPTYSSTHRTVNQATIDLSCTLCHNTTAVGTGPMPGAPSCFSSGFTNANNIVSLCHPNGPGSAPHATDGTYLDPDNHGPDAKTNLGLDFCKSCHAQLVTGNNYRFNVPVGQLLNGCEDCHAANAAHPPASVVLPTQDRWTFLYDTTKTRRTHFATVDPVTNCTLCHGVALDGIGGTAPTCFSCHNPDLSLQCSACHGTPPTNAPDDTGATPVDHTNVGDQVGFNSAHDECTFCHGAKDDGTGNLSVVGTDYDLFDRNSQALNQGGDHLDGNIEMNGPAPATGAGYNETTFNCFNACHSELPPFVMSDSTLFVEYGSYGNTPGNGCTFCHGYPPDGTPDATGALFPVDHTAVSNLPGFLTAHNDCSVCHGVKDDGTGTHLPTGNYDVATDHQDGNINLNLDTQYDQTNFGCDLACHSPNAPPYQLTNSGLPVVLDSYGSGGGTGACDSCHTSGAGGAPIVIAGTTPHTVSWTCEDCHTAHGGGTLIIPNNVAVGINYPAAGHLSGISLGGAATSGTTEAQICWNCHNTYNISEWGVNDNNITGNSTYNYGNLTGGASNWIGAEWNSGTAKFAYKTGTIQSTHAAGAGGVSGVDTVGNLRCSYCHDVHDLNILSSDNVSGQPYLRGTWMGNPYPEDGAPQNNDAWTTNIFGAVPRGTTASNEAGGYQIDQNNSNPTSGWTADDSSSLCELCHGTGDGTWDVGTTDGNGDNEIDRINEFGVASDDWIGTNGHSNSALGGTGNRAANIFSIADRNSTNPSFGGNDGQSAGNPAMAYQQNTNTGNEAYGWRNNSGDNGDGFDILPRTTSRRAFNNYSWGATIALSNDLDIGYHNFSCSKCHNPHASRLPRLMITNCLDTRHNDWDENDAGTISGTNGDGDTPSADNNGVTLSQSTSAQNCHRVKDPAFAQSRGAGWNNVTPW